MAENKIGKASHLYCFHSSWGHTHNHQISKISDCDKAFTGQSFVSDGVANGFWEELSFDLRLEGEGLHPCPQLTGTVSCSARPGLHMDTEGVPVSKGGHLDCLLPKRGLFKPGASQFNKLCLLKF